MEKADLGRRFWATVIDQAFMFLVSYLPFGLMASIVYLLTKDGLFNGASIGKRLVNLRVIATDTGRPASYGHSLRRNLIFMIPVVALVFTMFASLATALGGGLSGAGVSLLTLLAAAPLTILLWVAINIIEMVLVLTDPRGQRLGDRWARTQVVLAGVEGDRA